MSWRDRIAAEAVKAKEKLGEELTGLVAGPDGAASPEGFVLGLVRTARDPEDEDLTQKQVRKDARKRRRRLGIASFAAGPFAGAAGEATDLYTETATVCDLADLHDLPLSDLDIGAHMLVLWNVAADLGAGRAALDGTGPSIVALLQARWASSLAEHIPDRWTVVNTIKFIWRVRGLQGDLTDAAASGAFKRVLRAGAQTKEFLARAEAQLGVRPS
jgi:hypothetical protein